MRITIDTDVVLDRLRIDELGYGVPFAFFLAGILLLYGAIPGLANFSAISGYAKLGVMLISLTSIGAIVFSGYTYHTIDKTWWLLDKYRDGPDALTEDRA